MTNRAHGPISRLLSRLEPTIGRPTCKSGCDRCCRHSVPITSAEGLDILAHLNTLPAPAREPSLARAQEGGETREMGVCPLLDGHLCAAYQVRPVACRTQFVWHEAQYCDAHDVLSCTPAELLEIRYLDYLDRMIREAESGRIPFSGELGIVLTLLSEHGEEYRSGADLRVRLTPRALDGGLLRFPRGNDSGEMAETLRRSRSREAERFQTEPSPLGMPRALGVRERSELHPIRRSSSGRSPGGSGESVASRRTDA